MVKNGEKFHQNGEKMGFEGMLEGLREGESLVRSGREFQILGAAALNALEPMLVLTCGCAKNCCPCEPNAGENRQDTHTPLADLSVTVE